MIRNLKRYSHALRAAVRAVWKNQQAEWQNRGAYGLITSARRLDPHLKAIFDFDLKRDFDGYYFVTRRQGLQSDRRIAATGNRIERVLHMVSTGTFPAWEATSSADRSSLNDHRFRTKSLCFGRDVWMLTVWTKAGKIYLQYEPGGDDPGMRFSVDDLVAAKSAIGKMLALKQRLETERE